MTEQEEGQAKSVPPDIAKPFYEAINALGAVLAAQKNYLGPVVAAPLEAQLENVVEGFHEVVSDLIEMMQHQIDERLRAYQEEQADEHG